MRFGIVGAQFVVTLDADHGEDDDGGGFVGGVDAAEAYDAPLVGEFDNSAHAGPAVVRLLPGSGPPAPMRTHRRPHK
jgi:hypothetical protein